MSLINNIISNQISVSINNGNAMLNGFDILIDDGKAFSVIDYLNNDKKELDLSKVIIAIDHDTPASSSESSEKQKKLLEFSKKYQLEVYNGTGIGALLLLEEGFENGRVVLGCDYDITAVGAKGNLGLKVTPSEMAEAIIKKTFEIKIPEVFTVNLKGNLKAGVSSKDVVLTLIKDLKNHDIAGKVIEFIGDGLKNLVKDDYVTLCSLVGKTSALSALVNVSCESTDADLTYDLNQIVSMVVMPDSYDVISSLTEIEDEIKVKEVFLGGTCGGKLSDLRVAAKTLEGKRIFRGLRMIVAPCTSNIYTQMLTEGLLDIFLDAGCVVMNQGYSVDYGKSQGVLDAGEILVSAGNNNDKEMSGGKNSKIYIVSPYTAAKVAISGCLGKEIKEA